MTPSVAYLYYMAKIKTRGTRKYTSNIKVQKFMEESGVVGRVHETFREEKGEQ